MLQAVLDPEERQVVHPHQGQQEVQLPGEERQARDAAVHDVSIGGKACFR